MWLLGKFSPLKRYQRQMFRGLQDLQICSPKSILGKMTVLLLGRRLCFWKPQCPPQIKAACCWNTGPPMKMPFNNAKPLMRKHRQRESQPLMAVFLSFEWLPGPSMALAWWSSGSGKNEIFALSGSDIFLQSGHKRKEGKRASKREKERERYWLATYHTCR